MARKKAQSPAKQLASPKKTKASPATGARIRASPRKTTKAEATPNNMTSGKKSTGTDDAASSEDDVVESIEQPRGKSKSGARTSPGKSPAKKGSKVPAGENTKPNKAFTSRYERKDSYGKALKKYEQDAYRCALEGEEPPPFLPFKHSSNPNEYSECTQKADVAQAQALGIERARKQEALLQVDNSEQDIPYVGYENIKRPISSPGRGITPSRPTRSSPRKPSTKFARTPEKPGTSSRPPKRGAPANDTEESEQEAPPEKRRRGRPAKNATPAAKTTKTAKSTASEGKGKATELPIPEGQPSGKGRGTVASATNPRWIPGTTKANPFFETMPAPEVWHRRMAPYFPFGETPFMERVMSNQINEDLARNHDENVTAQKSKSGVFASLASAGEALGNLLPGRKSQDEPAESNAVKLARVFTASPWDLSEVDDKEVTGFLLHGAKPQFGSRAKRRASTGSILAAKSAKKSKRSA